MNLDFSPAIDALGWSLVHFLWQGTAIALILGVVLQTLIRRSAHLRYLVIGLTFVLMLGAFGATLIYQGKKAATAEAGLLRSITQDNADLDRAQVSAGEKRITSAPSPGTVSTGTGTPEVIAYPLSAASSSETDAKDSHYFSPERIRVMLPSIVVLWICGVVIFSLRTLWGLLRVRECLGSSEEPADPAWKDRFSALCKSVRVSRAVRLLSSSAVPVPIVVGWLKPAVLVPAGLFSQLPVYQLEAILAHELAHIRRHDFLVNLLQNVTETFFFFHPAIWWVSAQLRKEREHCCDDLAANQCGGAIEFARALTALEEVCGKAAPVMSVAATGGSLLERVRRLLGAAPPTPTPGIVYSWPAGILVFLIVAGAATGAHFVKGPRAARAPIVHGYSLAGVPSIPDTVGIPGIQENPHFLMSVEPDGGEPELIYPVGSEKPHFYLRYRDLTYGPIEGDPIKRMNLTKVLASQLNSLDPMAATKRVVEMLDLGDEVMLESSYKLIPQLKDYDHQAIASVLRETVSERSASYTALKGKMVYHGVLQAFHASALDEARDRWNELRTEIPEHEYMPGKPIDTISGAVAMAIQWGNPNEAGLRLGISGLDPSKAVPAGKDLDLKLFIHNDGDQDVRFTPPGRLGAGFDALFINEEGARIPQGAGSNRSIEPRVRLAPNQVYECDLAPIQTILRNEIGSPTTRKVQPIAWAVQPRSYRVELDFSVGVFDVRTDWGELNPDTIPGLDEWTGTLAAGLSRVQFAPPEIGTARPGETVAITDRHLLEFEKENVGLIFQATGETDPNGPVADVWKLKDFPESDYVLPEMWKSKQPEDGDYLAAWDVGGTRIWIRQGNHGIQCLEFNRTFRDGGRWQMRQAVDHLAYMPDGVRDALNLPGRFYMRSPYASGPIPRW